MRGIKDRDIRFKGFKKLETANSALTKYLAVLDLKPTPLVEVPLRKAKDRVLAEDVTSPVDVPPFNRASMDGYAVREVDIRGAVETTPLRLKVVGKSLTGQPFKGQMKEGETVEIATGAEIPEEADAVVMYESTKRFEDEVEIYGAVTRWENVSRRGEDVRKGDLIARAGRSLTSFDLALIASLGISRVPVRKRPVIALIAVGEELVDVYKTERSLHKIIETNRLMLSGLVEEYGGEPLEFDIVGDNIEDIEKVLSRALVAVDIVVFTGGTSVGEMDLLPRLIGERGDIFVHGVSMRPGKPIVLARVEEKPVVCLPGYPVAAAVDFLFFVRPLMEALVGVKGRYLWRKILAKTSKRIPSRPGIRHYVRVKLIRRDGMLYAHPVGIGGAGILSTLTEADGFVVVREEREGIEKGEEVEVQVYRSYVDEQSL
ncbi:MAG: molybdopterin molybdenumtransferase MoeA [Nitrososphaeria archaeon]|nr:molybdopterin molybdenumtransferase MoeA [Nitrososphaeria archaeon]NIN53046.1 molybdopterin molybdenumtransferase MoeA [Nitrososphaeria archaeon]NIQ33633.1 molybdopterin molybdenumtransferase MoeA [Nitrososphaeria archaeon]